MNTFLVQFGTGNPTAYTGLSPTFISFSSLLGVTSPPGITEVPSGTGLYYFNYTVLSPVAFVIDGSSTITNPTYRYVSGFLDPTTSSMLGTLADSFGSTLADPTSIIGYLKRLQEFNEGNNTFTKQSGAFALWSRGVTHSFGSSVYAGSSALLIEKTVTDSGSIITKS